LKISLPRLSVPSIFSVLPFSIQKGGFNILLGLISCGSYGASTGAKIAIKHANNTIIKPTVPVLLLHKRRHHLFNEDGLFSIIFLDDTSATNSCDSIDTINSSFNYI